MIPFPTVISFYTIGTPYQTEAQNLIESCKKFEIDYDIEGVESFGCWELNCAYKAFFIYKKLMECKKPLLWVDADGVFVSKPNWIEVFNFDFAVRMHEDLPFDHPSKVISSTLYVAYNARTQGLIKLWARECEKQLLDPERTEEFWDQIALRDALLSKQNEAHIASMPIAYSKIFDHPQDNEQVFDTVIEHYQASRRYKNLI